MLSLQEAFDSAKDGSGIPAHKQNTQSIISKKKTRPTKMKYQSYAPPYHPSLQSTNNNANATRTAQHQLTNKLQPLQLPTLQSNYINAKMNELRNLAANANKRQKKVDDHHQHSHVVESVTSPHNCNYSSSDGFDMLEELDGHSNVVQIVATSGGMITHWNESFTKLTKQPSSSSSSSCCPQDTTNNNNPPLTIFELVDSKSLPSLYSMLAMALHNVSIVDVEDFTLVEEEVVEEEEVVGDKRKRTAAKEDDTTSSSSHLSITLPCKSFHGTRTRYNITVVFMNDTTSMKRSFLGILTPKRRRSTSSSSQDDDASSSSTITSCSSSGVPNVTSSEKDTTTEDEQDTQDICKALKKEEEEEYATSSPSCNVRQLPRDKIIRVNDKLLCRMLLGCC